MPQQSKHTMIIATGPWHAAACKSISLDVRGENPLLVSVWINGEPYTLKFNMGGRRWHLSKGQ